MLHDPRHDKTPSFSGFALFVASKDPNENYDWTNCIGCAVGQYLKSMDVHIEVSDWKNHEVLNTANNIARGEGNHDWNFGKLSNRIFAHQLAS